MARIAAFDFAIIGSTPLSDLLAGLIASSHGKSVCLISERLSPIRLIRGIDLSVAPLTRPETWDVLKSGTADVTRLLGRIGAKAGPGRLDPLFIAERRETMAALSHARHMAAAFGVEVQRLPPHQVMSDADVCRMRDGLLLDRALVQPPLDAWLGGAGIKRLSGPDVAYTLHRDGSVRVEHGKFRFEVERTVLADDAAILANLGEDNYGRTLSPRQMTSILTEPIRPLASPLMVYLDRDVTLLQKASRNVTALIAGSGESASAALGQCLAGQTPIRRAGQTSYTMLVSRDGAPVIGRVKGSKAHVMAGLGTFGAFLAPMLARAIAGEPNPREQVWLDAHDPSRNRFRGNIAEFGAALPMEAQA